MARNRHQEAEKAGRAAEAFAAFALQLKGYVILARRAKTSRGEIDLIARKGKILAFIEVKQRKRQLDPATILTPQQMQRIVNAATGWASRRGWTHGYQWRYDLIVIVPWAWPRHMQDAWRPEGDPILETGSQGANSRSKQMRRS